MEIISFSMKAMRYLSIISTIGQCIQMAFGYFLILNKNVLNLL